MAGPRTSRATAIVAARSSSSASGTPRIFVSGLARKFCTITSWMPPYSRATPRIAKIESARSARVSPMPIRMPVVNGTLLRPASSSTRSRTAGSLSGLPKCGPPRSVNSRDAVVSSIMPMEGATGLSRWKSCQLEHARVQVREQAGLLQDPDGHGPDVGQRVVVAVRVQPLPGLRPARLRLVAQGEQGFLAAEGGTVRGDPQHLVRRQVRALQPPGHRHERAVTAAVAAQPGQRDEDLARVGDDAGPARRGQPAVPGPAGVAEQFGQLVPAGVQQHGRLGGIQGLAVPGPGQRPAHRAGGRLRFWLSWGAGTTGGGRVSAHPPHPRWCLARPRPAIPGRAAGPPSRSCRRPGPLAPGPLVINRLVLPQQHQSLITAGPLMAGLAGLVVRGRRHARAAAPPSPAAGRVSPWLSDSARVSGQTAPRDGRGGRRERRARGGWCGSR